MGKSAIWLFLALLLAVTFTAEALAETQSATLQVFCSIPKYLELPGAIDTEDVERIEEAKTDEIDYVLTETTAKTQHIQYQKTENGIIYTIIEQ